MKKLISTALCAVLATGSVISATGAGVMENTGVKPTGSSIRIQNNKLSVYTYNLPSDTKYGVRFKGGTTGNCYDVDFKDCIGAAKTITIPSTENYARYFTNGSGNIYASYSFAKTGGDYVKVRVKLSDVAPDYFNENGTHTKSIIDDETHDYNFTYEDLGRGHYYTSGLYFQSGGVVTGAAPDADGCVEIYISTNIGDRTQYCTTFSCRGTTDSGRWFSIAGGGSTGTPLTKLYFGNIDLEGSVNVNDATALQMYLSGSYTNFDSLQYFYADVNRDGKRDVRDVTALQKGIAD